MSRAERGLHIFGEGSTPASSIVGGEHVVFESPITAEQVGSTFARIHREDAKRLRRGEPVSYGIFTSSE